ncbi:MAG TPA: adenylate/guanylate cyclase domain-containing protein [Candidatus Dormibacteraeota bacterium]|nr:adenylate/guanylate cyclase domain-containing protein [Candidatus Dormibacteraeota bacterium]
MTLPTGPAVTFLFTDIEGSTRLERAVGSADWASLVARHDALLRAAIQGSGGVVVKTEGDAFFAAFDRPDAAAEGAVAAQRAIAAADWPTGAGPRIRMGLHIGEGRLRHGRAEGDPEDYVGIDVNYAARIAAAGNGGQVVLSQALFEALASPGATFEAAPGVSITDEGLRAVKDFEEPMRLYRLVVAGAADDDRPLRTLEPPSNLPAQVTELVGRAAEIERLGDVLAGNRIVTLTGPGGSGKTRLALGVAQAVRDRFPHGSFFVDLAAVRDVGLLESAIGATLGLRESASRAMGDALRGHLRDRTVLLLLDNLEQLLPPAAEIVGALARGAPALRLLITSRELLRIGGERGQLVPPLEADAGVELFEARALALRPDMPLTEDTVRAIRAICERLNGLPLAIELAAARVRLLSPALILERLSNSLDLSSGSRDLPERQRTLRGAIDWSHELLSEPERRLFRRLSVFAGGWTAEMALQVADPDGTLGIGVLDGLESLADKSLVRIQPAGTGPSASDEARFDIHPLLREYGLEQLQASGERAATEARHAAAIVAMAEAVGGRIFGTGGNEAIARIDLEQHNVRAALDWATAHDDSETGLRLMGAVWRWFQQRGRLREGRALLARLLAQPWTEARLRIVALAADGGLAYWSDDFERAKVVYDERLKLAEGTGDQVLIADAHYDLGFLSMVASDPIRHRDHEQLAYDLYAAAGRDDGVLRARQALVLGVFLSGDYERARELEQQNEAAFRAIASLDHVADSMTLQAGVEHQLGNPAEAWARMADGLRYFSDNNNSSGLARGLGMAAIIQLTYGDAEFGARIAAVTYQLMRDKGVMLAPVKVLHLRDPHELAIERLGAEETERLLADAATIPVSQMVDEIFAATPSLASTPYVRID